MKDGEHRKLTLSSYNQLFRDMESDVVFRAVTKICKEQEYPPSAHTIFEYVKKVQYDMSLETALKDGHTEKGIDSWYLYDKQMVDGLDQWVKTRKRFWLQSNGLYLDEKSGMEYNIHEMKNYGFTKDANRPLSDYEQQDAYNLGYDLVEGQKDFWVLRYIPTDGIQVVCSYIRGNAIMRYRLS